jgi:hypothetical protein
MPYDKGCANTAPTHARFRPIVTYLTVGPGAATVTMNLLDEVERIAIREVFTLQLCSRFLL